MAKTELLIARSPSGSGGDCYVATDLIVSRFLAVTPRRTIRLFSSLRKPTWIIVFFFP